MIARLRRKFTAAIMSVVAALIMAAFVGVLASTAANLERESRDALRAAISRADEDLQGARAHVAQQPGSPSNTGPASLIPAPKRIPSLTVGADSSGNVTGFKNQIFRIEDSQIQTLASLALGSGREEGTLREYELRYLVERAPDGSARIAFVDIAIQKHVFERLLLSAAAVALPALALFFPVSVLLARWVVRPAERAWESQRQFVADASHELKTPLTVILTNAEMLASSRPSSDGRESARLRNILEEARRMKSLVDDLLTLARLDAPVKKPAFAPVDLSAVVHQAALVFEPVLYDAGRRFEYAVEEGVFVLGDAQSLRQLAEILLDNACKYGEAGGLVSLRLKASARGEAALEVTNEGSTIPPEELKRIFERFYRSDRARTGGSGLGLSIAEGIVREHGGKIHVRSENSRTTFTVAIPAVRP